MGKLKFGLGKSMEAIELIWTRAWNKKYADNADNRPFQSIVLFSNKPNFKSKVPPTCASSLNCAMRVSLLAELEVNNDTSWNSLRLWADRPLSFHLKWSFQVRSLNAPRATPVGTSFRIKWRMRPQQSKTPLLRTNRLSVTTITLYKSAYTFIDQMPPIWWFSKRPSPWLVSWGKPARLVDANWTSCAQHQSAKVLKRLPFALAFCS